MIRIGLNGYGNLNYLGSINGFTIIYPKDPSIEDIGLFNNHIIKGYPEKWKLKESAMEISRKYLEEMGKILNEFETEFNKIIKNNNAGFEYYDTRSDKNIHNRYYYSNISKEIFNEIQNKWSRELYVFEIDGSTSIYFKSVFSNSSDVIMSIDSKFDPKGNECIQVTERLKNDDELKNLVNKYNIKFKSFENNQGKDFGNFIRTLEENIINQNTDELEGTCKECLLKKLINRLKF